MSENPYSPPSADLVGERAVGPIDIGVCFSEAWQATLEHFPLWLGVGVVGTLAALGSTLTVLGVFLLLPHLMFGSYLFLLRMQDGDPAFSDLFEGFNQYGNVLGRMLLAWLALIVINVVVQSLAVFGAVTGSDVLSGAGQLVNLAFALFASPRLMLCFYYIVDRGEGGIESIQSAWGDTAGCPWWLFPVLVLVTYAVMLAGLLALVVGVIPATLIAQLMWTSAYRQLVGGVERGAHG